MGSKKEYFSNVINGKLQKNVSAQIGIDLESFEGKRVRVVIEISRKIRSRNQNAYYWGVIVPAIQYAVNDMWGEDIGKDETHELIKFHCNYREQVVEATGEVIRIPISTAELTTLEAEEMYDRARKWAYTYFNTVIPLPNENIDAPL